MELQKKKILYEDMLREWNYSCCATYLLELLNGEYQVEELRKDLLGLLSLDNQ